MCLPFTCLLLSYLGVFTKFKVKSRGILSSAFLGGGAQFSIIIGIILEIHAHC